MIKLHFGDCRDVMSTMAMFDEKFDVVLTDPPYHLESVARRFGKPGSAPARPGADGRFTRQSRGFIGKRWDGADKQGNRIAFDPEVWAAVLDLLKPGAFCMAFASPRTGHRQAVAMEDAGFVLHPFHGWLYGQGMSKGHAVEPEGWYHGAGTLKPALEPVYVGQRPSDQRTGQANMDVHGVGAYNIEASRVPVDKAIGRWPANLVTDRSPEVEKIFPITTDQQGRAKTDGSFRTGSVYGERRQNTTNPEPRGDEGSAARYFNGPPAVYCAKAPRHEKAQFRAIEEDGTDAGSHPTVKPQWLLEHFLRLVTPSGGRVLDPFGGSGSTAAAAAALGLDCELIEADPSYMRGLRRRFPEWMELL